MTQGRPRSLLVVTDPAATWLGTSRLERLLLMGTIAVLPLQETLPLVGGVSVLFLLFGLMGIYVFLGRLSVLVRVWRHPVFLSGYLLVSVGLLMELGHSSRGFQELFRILAMVLGGVVVACLCRDRRALRACFWGYLIAGVWLSGALLFGVFGDLLSVSATDFTEASQVRSRIFHNFVVEGDKNAIALFVAQGAIVAFAAALAARRTRRRGAFLLLALLCSVACFLPMSRGSVAILFLSLTAVVWKYGMVLPRGVVAFAVVAGSLLFVPTTVLQRLTVPVSDGTDSASPDARVVLVRAFARELPEFLVSGVGVTHFYGRWGEETGFFRRGRVSGTHNALGQVTVFWGLPGLCALVLLLVACFFYFPYWPGRTWLPLCLLGLCVSVFLKSMLVHTIHDKEFSLALGLLVGVSMWIRPRRTDARHRFQEWARPPRRPLGSNQ